PHHLRHHRAGSEQRSVLHGAAESRSPGRNAHLRTRPARHGPGSHGRSAFLLAGAPGRLAARARPAPRRGKVKPNPRTARAIGLMISPSGPWTVTSTLNEVSGGK